MGFTGVILGVTGNGLQTDIDKFMASGVDRVLLKPLNMTKFEAALSSKCRILITREHLSYICWFYI